MFSCCRGSKGGDEDDDTAESTVFYANFEQVPRGLTRTLSARSGSSTGTVRSRAGYSVRNAKRKFLPVYTAPKTRPQKGGYFNEELPAMDTLSESDRKRIKASLTKSAGQYGKGKGQWEREMRSDEKNMMLDSINTWDSKGPIHFLFDEVMSAPMYHLVPGSELDSERKYSVDCWLKSGNLTTATEIIADAEANLHVQEWASLPTLVYLQFAIRFAHRMDGMIEIANQLLSNIRYYNWERYAPFSEADIISKLKSQCKPLQTKLGNMTTAHRKHHQLQNSIGQIKFSTLPKGVLTQRDHISFLHTDYLNSVMAATGTQYEQNSDLTFMAMMQILAEYLAPLFDKDTRGLSPSVVSKRDLSKSQTMPPTQHDLGSVKTWGQMYAKRSEDDEQKRKRRLPTAQYNRDLIRKKLVSHSAAEQVAIVNEIKRVLNVVGCKNSFSKSNSETHDIVLTVVYNPKTTTDGGAPLTFNHMLHDKKGFQTAVDRAKSKTDKYNARWFDYATKAYQLVLPSIGAEPIKMLAELQLVLQFYEKVQKLSAFYTQITTSASLHELRNKLEPKIGDVPTASYLAVKMSRQTLRN